MRTRRSRPAVRPLEDGAQHRPPELVQGAVELLQLAHERFHLFVARGREGSARALLPTADVSRRPRKDRVIEGQPRGRTPANSTSRCASGASSVLQPYWNRVGTGRYTTGLTFFRLPRQSCENPINKPKYRAQSYRTGCGGPPWQGGGQGFEPPRLHSLIPVIYAENAVTREGSDLQIGPLYCNPHSSERVAHGP